MTERTVSPPSPQPDASGRVSLDEYMDHYAHDHYEWVEGELLKMSPVSEDHDALTGYFYMLLQAYFAYRPIGQTRHEPFVMRLDAINRSREPDLQVILDSNPGQLTRTAMIGPADICIEVVSDESVSRDYGDKLVEYEKASVQEYWMVDPRRRTAHFHRRSAEGIYQLIPPDEAGNYETPLLPGLKLHAPTLWREPLPDFFAIGESVRQMLGE